MIRIKALQSFAGVVSMRIGEERIVELTDTMQEMIDCGHVEVLEDLDDRYDGIELKEMNKRQLVRYAKDNRIPIAEKEPIKKILKQVESYLGTTEQTDETK